MVRNQVNGQTRYNNILLGSSLTESDFQKGPKLQIIKVKHISRNAYNNYILHNMKTRAKI